MLLADGASNYNLIAGTEGVALCRSSLDLQQMTLSLYSRSLNEEVELEATGHASDIALLLEDFAAVVRDREAANTRLATGEDGYWAQFATEMANRRAMESRVS